MKQTKLVIAAVAAVLTFNSSSIYAADALSEFRVGILGGENQNDRLRSHACIKDAAEKQLGVKTELFAPADYNGVIEGLLGGNLDMAWLGASAYAKAFIENPDAIEPVLVPVNPDGSTGYYSIGFARVDSNIDSLDAMRDKVFAFGDPNSTSGYLIPSIEIPQAGYSMENGEYFKEIVFSGGHEQTIVGVYNGDYNAGVTWADGQGEWEDGYNNGALRKAVDAGLVDMTEMKEIWRSNVIPNGPVVVRKDLPVDVKEKISAMILDMGDSDKECLYGLFSGEVQGAAPTDHDFYASVVAARKKKIGG